MESKILFCIEKQVCKNILAWKHDKSSNNAIHNELEENFPITIEKERAFIHCISASKIVRIPITIVVDNGFMGDGKIIIIPKDIIEMISKDKSIRNVVDFSYDKDKIKIFLKNGVIEISEPKLKYPDITHYIKMQKEIPMQFSISFSASRLAEIAKVLGNDDVTLIIREDNPIIVLPADKNDVEESIGIIGLIRRN